MDNLCDWSYRRGHYLILMLAGDGSVEKGYYSPGTQGVNKMAQLQEIYGVEIIDISSQLNYAVINNDDSIKDTLQKLELITKYRYESYYLYCGPAGQEQNMLFGYLYNISNTQVRPFKYDQNIIANTFNERFTDDESWTKHANMSSFDTCLMSKYVYEDLDLDDAVVHIINCVTIDKYLQLLQAADKISYDSVYHNNKYRIQTFYPTLEANILNVYASSPDNFISRILHSEDSVAYKDLHKVVMKGIYTTNLVNSNHVMAAMTQDFVSMTPVKFYDCNILEAVVHINYNLDQGSFVDVEKIFKMFPVTEEWPFSRLKTDKETSYYVHQSLTEPNSPTYMDIRAISDWINPTVSKNIDRSDIHAIQKATIDRNTSRGVSYKLLNYINSEGVRKYMTLNIYKDGKMELKCSWDEKFSVDAIAPDEVNVNPGGNMTLVRQAIEKVIDFVTKLNMLQYHVPGSKTQKIPLPTTNVMTEGTNTNIVFFNTITVFNYGELLNNEKLAQFSDHFNAYAHRVNNYIDNNTIDYRNLELRYSRINNYIRLKSLHEHIKNYKDHNKEDFNRKRLVDDLATIHGLTTAGADLALKDYEAKYEANKKKGQRKFLSVEDMSKVLGRKINKQTGVHMKILKVFPKKADDYHYKCLVLGVNKETQSAIYHFIRAMITIFQNQEMMLLEWRQDIEPPYMALMLNENATVEVEKTVREHMAEITEANKKKDDQQQEQEEEDEYESERRPDFAGFNPFADQEQESQEVEAPVEASASEATTSAKTSASLSVFSKKSFMDILKGYGTGTGWSEFFGMSDISYSRYAQASTQPMVIKPSYAEKLKVYLKGEIEKTSADLQTANETGQWDLEWPPDRLEKKLREYKVHLASLEAGGVYTYKGLTPGFFFCPLTWNKATNITENEADAFPLYEEVDVLNATTVDNRYHKNRDAEMHKLGSDKTPYKMRLMFRRMPDGRCYPKCGKKYPDAGIWKACVVGDQTDITEKQLRNIEYVVAEGKHPSPGRYAFINSAINRIFNHDDSGKKLSGSNITRDFNYYLRKGNDVGKHFLGVIGNIMGKPNATKILVDFLRDGPDGSFSEESIDLFRTLKGGALNQVFLPTSNEPQALAQALEDTTVVMERFISYIESQPAELNEDFLWDLITKPGCFLPQGFNLIICDIKYVKRTHTIELASIKCPIGFDINTLYNKGLPTLVLCKYSNKMSDIYETVCLVTHDGVLRDKVLFDPNDLLIDAIIDHLRSKCITLPNLEAEKELQKHIKNVGSNDMMQTLLLNDNEPITTHIAKELLDATGAYNIVLQATDKYNKVTHLVIAPTDGAEEDIIVLPVVPSGILPSIDMITVDSLPIMGHLETIKVLLELATYDNFVGYTPYAFMLDPGEDLDDPNDDVILGLVLSNGLIVKTLPVKVANLETGSDAIIRVSYRDPEVNMAEVDFNIRNLLFAEESRSQVWYSDYLKADQELGNVNLGINDKRKVYSVRADFENETYQRLRYELTRYINKTDQDGRLVAAIEDVLSGGTIENKRRGMREILDPLIRDLIVTEVDGNGTDVLTGDQIRAIEDAIGPLNKGYDQLSDDDYAGPYRYTYLKPVIRYECHNPDLDTYRGVDTHCVNNKLFVPSTNVLSGIETNIDNYIGRIIEEIIRIPLKRREILYNEMDNFVTEVHSVTENAYHINHTEDIYENLSNIYRKTVNYLHKLKENYDLVNPDNHTAASSNRDGEMNCVKSFRNLPNYWLRQIGSMNFKYVEIKGPENCVYRELDQVIGAGFPDQDIDTRKAIADVLASDSFTSYDGRAAWEMARDHYARLWPDAYDRVNTRENFLHTVRKSDRHHLQLHDLSLISREYNIKFIILSEPNRLTQNGVVCLQTTQTLVSRYVILYQSSINRFHIVKDVTTTPPRGLFTAEQLPPKLLNEWVNSCISDNRKEIDPANHVFAIAPVEPRKLISSVVPLRPKLPNADAPKINLSGLIPIVPTVPKQPPSIAPIAGRKMQISLPVIKPIAPSHAETKASATTVKPLVPITGAPMKVSLPIPKTFEPSSAASSASSSASSPATLKPMTGGPKMKVVLQPKTTPSPAPAVASPSAPAVAPAPPVVSTIKPLGPIGERKMTVNLQPNPDTSAIRPIASKFTLKPTLAASSATSATSASSSVTSALSSASATSASSSAPSASSSAASSSATSSASSATSASSSATSSAPSAASASGPRAIVPIRASVKLVPKPSRPEVPAKASPSRIPEYINLDDNK